MDGIIHGEELEAVRALGLSKMSVSKRLPTKINETIRSFGEFPEIILHKFVGTGRYNTTPIKKVDR